MMAVLAFEPADAWRKADATQGGEVVGHILSFTDVQTVVQAIEALA